MRSPLSAFACVLVFPALLVSVSAAQEDPQPGNRSAQAKTAVKRAIKRAPARRASAKRASAQRTSAKRASGKLASGKLAGELYAVPEGDVKALLSFLHRIQTFRPTTVEQFLAQRQNQTGALKKAAERILKIEKDRESQAAKTAYGILLGLKIENLSEQDPDAQRTAVAEIQRYLASLAQLTSDDLVLALKTAAAVKQSGNAKLAAEAYQTFGQLFSAYTDETLAGYGKEMVALARQIKLPGNEIAINGTTLDGDTFDWSAYRGKVVLVDFWATWCGPCVAELPNVKRHYDQYHDRGFEVVGISLDRNQDLLAKFVEDRELPWVTLYEPGAGGDHPVASYYGIRTIPTAILVDREGKVVSLEARGVELGRQLDQLLGAAACPLDDE